MPSDDRGPGRVKPAAAAALLGSNVLVFLGIFALAPALPAVRANFAATTNVDMLTQLVGAMAGFAFALGSLLVGRLMNRFGYRTVYLASLLAFAVAGTGAIALSNLYLIILSRAIVGLASAGIVNAALVAIGRLMLPEAQARTLGLQTLIGSVVAILGFPLIGQLAGIDWRLAFGVHLVALIFVPLVLSLPDTGHSEGATGHLPPPRNVARLILVAAVFAGMVIFIATVFGPLFLVGLGVTNPGLLSIPPTAASVGSVIGSMLYVALRPRIGNGGTFALSLAAMAAGLATAALSPNVWGVAAGSFIALLGGGAFSPNLNSAAMLASPHNPGPTLGLVNALMYGAMILFPLIASPVASLTGGPRTVLLVYAAAAGLLSIVFAVRPLPRNVGLGDEASRGRIADG